MKGFIGLAGVLFLDAASERAYVTQAIKPLGLIACVTFLTDGMAYMFAGILLAWTQSRRIRENWTWQVEPGAT